MHGGLSEPASEPANGGTRDQAGAGRIVGPGLLIMVGFS
jgi:hypothetical protein